MDELKTLIDKAIIYEDEFIENYMKLIRDEGFIKNFEDQEKAKDLLNILIEESKEHKQTLEDISSQIK